VTTAATIATLTDQLYIRKLTLILLLLAALLTYIILTISDVVHAIISKLFHLV